MAEKNEQNRTTDDKMKELFDLMDEKAAAGELDESAQEPEQAPDESPMSQSEAAAYEYSMMMRQYEAMLEDWNRREAEEQEERRARELISLGNRIAGEYLKTWLGRESVLLPEEKVNGCWEGYTPEYIRVRLDPSARCEQGVPVRILLDQVCPRRMGGKIIG